MQASGVVELGVPAGEAYRLWADARAIPRFLDGVERVDHLDAVTSRWVTTAGGVRRRFDAVRTGEVPGQRVRWTSLDGPRQVAEAVIEELGSRRCRVTLRLEYAPGGVLEQVGDRTSWLRDSIARTLQRFATLVESEQAPGAEGDEGRTGEPVATRSPPG